MSVEVLKLGTDQVSVYSGITPTEAVIAAFAQDAGDWHTWCYAQKYSSLVRKTDRVVSCGDFTALV